jgi:outer membrane protein assembly factor BamB
MPKRHLLLCAALFVSFFGVADLHAQTGADTLTWHNDVARDGTNRAETILTLANVNPASFGKRLFVATDGVVDAQPLYVAGLSLGGAARNVVFVATEHDSVYALDAATGAVLWQASMLEAGETTSGSQGCGQITPEIGITATPVIDLSEGPNGAIYVVSMSEDASGKYHQRINALDLATGAQLFGGPATVAATYSYGQGTVAFNPGQYAERSGLLEWNGSIYTAWTSHCDATPYNGWILAYDAATLKQTQALSLTPNGSQGAVWMGGAGLAATPTRILFLDGNGTFDTALDSHGFPEEKDFGNAFIGMTLDAKGKLQISDYYATDTTVQQSSEDVDLGSGGLIALPGMADESGNVRQLAVGAGKDTNIYLVDRTNMGKYNPNGGYIYQVLPGALPHGEFGAPAYFLGHVYYGGVSDYLKAFSISGAKLVATPASESANVFAYPGTTPVISADVTRNGIVWAISHTKPAVLYAYSAENLAEELYDSNQSGTRDQFGSVDHFVSPLVANGRVYVPTTAGIAIFGLLGN